MDTRIYNYTTIHEYIDTRIKGYNDTGIHTKILDIHGYNDTRIPPIG